MGSGSVNSFKARPSSKAPVKGKNDRFSKNYSNLFQGAGSRISAFFQKSDMKPEKTPKPAASSTKGTYKKLRSFKKFPSGTKLSEAEALAYSKITGTVTTSERATSQKPSGIGSKEWYAVNAYLMFNAIVRYYGWLHEKCTAETCPKMTAGRKYEFKWADGKTTHVPKSIPARDYLMNVLDWTDYQFKDVSIFPNYDGAYYSRSRFIPVIQDIFKRLLRLYAHVLLHHMKDLKEAQVDDEFIKFLKHFMDLFERHDILQENDIKPVSRSIEWFNIQNMPGIRQDTNGN